MAENPGAQNPATDRTLRWGILSTAKIARNALVPALKSAENCDLVAVGSRDEAKAQAFGESLGIDRRYGGYEALLEDPDVDAIYNPLPNHLHAPMTLAAARAGKHVLCEKPFTMDQAEAQALQADLAAIGNGVVVMEAFMYQFHPQWQAVRSLIEAGRIGRVVAVQTWFSYFGDDPANIRHNPDWGGGALMDIGCYAIHSARRIFGAEPTRTQGSLGVHPTYGVDVSASAVLDFPDGHATFTVATQADPDQRVHIIGTDGRIEVTRPFNPTAGQETVVRVGSGLGDTYGDSLDETLRFGPADQYAIMVQQFSAAALAGEPSPVGLGDAVANMAVIDAVRRSAT